MKIFDFLIIVVTLILYIIGFGTSTTLVKEPPEDHPIECSPKLSWFEAIFLFPLSFEACNMPWGLEKYDEVTEVREENLDPGVLYAKEEEYSIFSLHAYQLFTWLGHLDEITWQYILQLGEDCQWIFDPAKEHLYCLPTADEITNCLQQLQEIARLRLSELYLLAVTLDGRIVSLAGSTTVTAFFMLSIVYHKRKRQRGKSIDELPQNSQLVGSDKKGEETVKTDITPQKLAEVIKNLTPILEASVEQASVQSKSELEYETNKVYFSDRAAKVEDASQFPDTEVNVIEPGTSSQISEASAKVELSEEVLDMLLCVRANCHHVHHVQDALTRRVEKIGELQDKILDSFALQGTQKSPRGLNGAQLHPLTYPYEGSTGSKPQQTLPVTGLVSEGVKYVRGALGSGSAVPLPYHIEGVAQVKKTLALENQRKQLLDISLDSEIGEPCANSSFKEDQGDIDVEWKRYDPQNLLDQCREMERRINMYKGLLGKPDRPSLPPGLDTDSSMTEGGLSHDCSSHLIDVSYLNDSSVYYGEDRSFTSFTLLYTLSGVVNRFWNYFRRRDFDDRQANSRNQNNSTLSQHSNSHNRSMSTSRNANSTLNSITQFLDLIE